MFADAGQPVQRLLQGDVAVEVVAPVAGEALLPFPPEPPGDAGGNPRPLGGGRRQRGSEVDAADELQRRQLPRFGGLPAPRFLKVRDFASDRLHCRTPDMSRDYRGGGRARG
jgi:hypothetical protein